MEVVKLVVVLASTALAASAQTLTLDQAVQEAVANNLDLAAERLNISVAQARQLTAHLRPNPVLTVSGMTLNVFRTAYSSDSPLGPNELNVHTDIPFERGQKRELRVELAREEISQAELAFREVMRQIIANTQNAFVDVQQAQANLSLAEDNLKRMESVVAINEARLNSGDLAQVELDRSRVAALQYQAAVQQAQLLLDQAKAQLKQILGRQNKEADIEVARELRRDEAAGSRDDLTRLAVDRRPDLRLAQQGQARSRADLRLQLANAKVDYTLGTEFSRQWAYGIGGNSMGFSFSVPLPVYNRNQGEIARAQREIGLNAARAAALASSIRTEVDKAYRQYSVSRQLLGSIESGLLVRARSVRDTTEYSYKRGEASLVEFLDAQRAFNDAMQTFNDARANYARSLYLLDTVTGSTVSGT